MVHGKFRKRRERHLKALVGRKSHGSAGGASRVVRSGLKIPFDLLQFLVLIVQLSIGLNAAIFDDSKELPAVSIRLCHEAHGGGIQARVEGLERVWRAGCFPGGGRGTG